MSQPTPLADDPTVVQRILDHIERDTTDLGREVWREPVANYRSPARFEAERQLLRRGTIAFCPSAALPGAGAFVARDAAGTALVAVRGDDGVARVFKNACRHRGVQVAEGAGCQRAFACRYHGWTYGLDGGLRHVPHERGFPGLDKAARGLAPVASAERHGMVFVAQEAPLDTAALDALPPLVPADYRHLGTTNLDIDANWKVLVEGFLEGYHIRATHPQTFYPIQFDNLNVVESFGPNNRIAFPYKAIHGQRKRAPAERTADGTLTYVYHLFPNVMVATFPSRIIVVVLEPLALDRTRFVTSAFTNVPPSDAPSLEAAQRGRELVDAGAAEDREVACSIQRSLASGANEFFEFGLFESAIGHFHRALRAALGEPTR
jgi:phenylpropionate dioxygenase-like ring-hydroxylating dioxygenase large terminal subunit